MSFLNPVLLAVGGVLIGLPILLHLIMQQKPRNLVFPALRFVQERLSTNQRRLRVRHWILLLIRCLAVFFVALAFAMPSAATNLFGTWLTIGLLGFVAILSLLILIATIVLTKPLNRILFGVVAAIFAASIATLGSVYMSSVSDSAAAKLGSDQSPVTAVVLIDTSPRMEYVVAKELADGSTQSLTRLAESQKLADWLIRELPGDSDVAILDSSAKEPFFSVDIAAAAKRISALQVSHDSVSLVERIESSIDFLNSVEDEKTKPLEIYVFTDMTLESWKSNRQKQLSLRLADQKEISLYLVDVSVENATNYQLGDLELSSEVTSSGGTINIVTRVLRQGSPGERPVNLYLDKNEPGKPFRRDGKTVFPDQKLVRSSATRLEENGVQLVAFTLKDLPMGVHHGVVMIEGNDPLKADNSRHFTIQIRPPRKTLIIRPQKKDETESEVASTNVEYVLAPVDFVKEGIAQFEVTTVDQQDLLNQKLGDYESVFLLDPKPLSEPEWKSLAKFVANGGGLAVMLGENAKSNLGIDSSFLSDPAIDLLGGLIGEAWTPGNAQISINDYSHPVLRKFKAYETDDVWREFGVAQHWGFSVEEESENTNVVASFSNQNPALIETRYGTGSVIVMTTPLTEPALVKNRKRWNDLTTGECWPTALLIDEIGKYLVSANNSRLNYGVGDNVVIRQDRNLDTEEFLLFSPRDEEPQEVGFNEGEIQFRFSDAVGSYRLKPVGDVRNRQGFSVNFDRGQTDLQKVTETVLDSAMGKKRFKIAKTKEDIIREQSFVREGKKFFPLLITIFGVIVLLDLMISNRFYKGL